MKNLLFLLCMIALSWSCSSSSEGEPEPEPVPGQPKEYIVSLGMAGEILDIDESPLSKASSNDLYGIQVYSKTSTTKYAPYAYGLFDDKSLMTIKLLEGYTYKFEATMVVDGKNKIYSFENQKYDEPFSVSSATLLENKFVFDNTERMFFELGFATLKQSYTCNYYIPNIERFYGITEEYKPMGNENISIEMKRVCFGVKFIAEGLTEGKLKINIQQAPELNILHGQSEIQDIFTFYHALSALTTDNYSETIPVSISWEKSDGAIVPLINKDITFKRNVLTTITIKVKDTSTNNNIDITQESGEMTQGDNITIESGTGLDGNVDPVEN